MESFEATLSLSPLKPSVVVAMAQTTRKSEPQVSLNVLLSVSRSQYQCSLIYSRSLCRRGGVIWMVT